MSVHLGGSLEATLSGLDTATGFGVFLLLWATTWFATRTGLRYRQHLNRFMNRAVASTMVAGGWNGVYVWIVIIVTLLFFMIRDQRVASALAITLIGSTLGSLLAFVVGGLVGLLYGLLDLLLFGFSAWLVDWVTAPGGSSAGGA